LDRALTIGPELTAATTFTSDSAGKSLAFSSHGTPLELIVGAHYQLDDFQFGAGIGPGLTKAYGTPTLRGLASFTWSPAIKVIKDRDNDGILDDVDACPDVPGVTSMNPAKNGCPLPPPPPDRDHDGILDADDACPDVPGIKQPDPKLNGCPGKDTDGDGIWDFEDACPTRKGPKTSDPKTNGCPPDRDGDGIPDSVDACPDEKGPPSDDRRINGCPPPKDTDGDGIPDNVDACPTEKGIPELKGCPDKDTDGDGVVDRFDNCPTEKGPKENSGCPLKQKQLVVITKEKLEIKDKVYFDTNKATIQKKSFGLLEQISKVIVAHPEIVKVVVEGHTDNVGKPDTNQKLSEDRAASVKAFLTAHGVAAERIDSKGYGQDKPIDNNKTAAGRANNRRVEFTLPPIDAN
jgi:outer membrane protein OmpA-like peptidoglycan-associated protein